MRNWLRWAIFGVVSVISFSGVAAQEAPITLTLAGYAVPREAYGDIIPLFRQYWKDATGQDVIVQESYQASGAQSRAVAGGFEADVVALSLEPDITRLVDAGLVSADWKEDNAYSGFVTQSVVVLAVRSGNPLGISDWASVAQPGVQIITPDPATSGGAQWNILGAVGAARRGFVAGFEGETGETDFLQAVINNITVLDRDGRESFLTFERGVGDVALTYENEVHAGLAAGGAYELVYPTRTILIENPVAVVDAYAEKHGTTEIAEAFVEFLWSTDAQRALANRGFRPVNATVRAEYGIVDAVADETAEAPVATAEILPAQIEVNPDIVFPVIGDLFTIDEFGGWSEARTAYFGETGVFTTLIAQKSQ